MALIRALVLKDFRASALSSGDASTAYQFGALTSGQQLYAGLHLTSVLGTGAGNIGTTVRTLGLTIQSATASGFGSPTTQIATLTRSTVEGAQWATPVGGLSTEHSWFRALWQASTAGSTGAVSWKGLVYMGIKPAP